MNKYKLCFTVIVLFFQIFINSIHAQNWYKGNTHTHSTYSDGKMPLPDVVKAYRDAEYSFLFITDENKIAPIDNLSDSSFICLTGEEAIFDQHISCLNIKTAVPPTNYIDVIHETHDQGGFAVLNHPRRGGHIVDAYKVITSDEIKFIEIFNGKSEKDLWHDDQSMWDSVLSAGKLVYGVAADDFHEMKHLSKGWIMVNADTLQQDSIVKSIENGDFYSSTGPTITSIAVTDTSIYIVTKDAIEITFIGDNRIYLQTTKAKSALYAIQGNEGYIRIEAKNAGRKTAWTQPLYWNKTYIGLPERKPLNIVSNKHTPIQLYPNPTNNILNLSLSRDINQANYQISNSKGALLMSGQVNDNYSLDVSNLAKGIYFLKITDINFSQCYRFVKL